METHIKWLMVMAVTGSLVILLQYLVLARIRNVLTDALRQLQTYRTQDTGKTQISEKSSPAHR
jgi:hypothetical protein